MTPEPAHAIDRAVMQQSDGREPASYEVPGLERGIRLLGLFSRGEPEIGAAEITRRLGLPHATVYRLLHTLESTGMLRRSDRSYGLGPRILTLGYEYLSSQNVVEIARPELEQLRDRTNLSANLGVLDGRQIIYIAHVPSHRPLATRLQVGSRLTAHTSSIGRALLCSMTSEALSALFRGVKLVATRSEDAGSFDELKAQLDADREAGYVIKHGFYDEHGFYDGSLVAISAAISNHTGRAIAALSVSGPASLVTDNEARGWLKDDVCAAAGRISRLLGAPEPADVR